ncbi:MAG: hypothetical protein ACRC78_18500 [Planktothrix sp.]
MVNFPLFQVSTDSFLLPNDGLELQDLGAFKEIVTRKTFIDVKFTDYNLLVLNFNQANQKSLRASLILSQLYRNIIILTAKLSDLFVFDRQRYLELVPSYNLFIQQTEDWIDFCKNYFWGIFTNRPTTEIAAFYSTATIFTVDQLKTYQGQSVQNGGVYPNTATLDYQNYYGQALRRLTTLGV